MHPFTPWLCLQPAAVSLLRQICVGLKRAMLHHLSIHNLSASFIHVGWACDEAMWVPK